ncbi:hypothetical protein PaecuDRAFT_4704 [Paenibacillus curdlanolyticus YK9]|uniref:Uncharacterized protein n=1 Tax=Paenibacillus curdlanolyticus YK9 TaxID=717606 RepID=E0IGB1_9BACL|nr:hypothetical protein [Paenibacillus curdlanolyticus]EFM08513.1 hypothetical protein PaecuDRAFT_4704 [Paenibacillus curdlanolyticus YK9]
MNHTDRLMKVAQQYVMQHKQNNWVCAYAGGSVGRGEEDQYSDLDLNIYVTSQSNKTVSLHVPYEGISIQLHFHAWPGSQALRSEPWAHRFLIESRTVYDPYGLLEKLKPAAIRYFRSGDGRRQMLLQATEEVQCYLNRLDRCIREDNLLGAFVAIQVAWHAAATSFAWMKDECCSTGGLFPRIRHAEPTMYAAFQSICAQPLEASVEHQLHALASYRRYLQEIKPGLTTLYAGADQLIARKIERYIGIGELDYAKWVLRYEAMMCYIASVEDIHQFGEHVETLPQTMKEALRMLGVTSYSMEQLSELLHQVDWLTERAKLAV